MRILIVLVMAFLVSSCAQMQTLIMPSPIWSELSSAAEGGRTVSALEGEVTLRTAWKEPGKRIYVLATDAKGENVVYVISRKGVPPQSAPVSHNCVIRQDGMQCGDQMLQTTSGSLWEDVATHAREQLPTLRAEREAAMREEIAMAESRLAVTQRKYDLARERHPFEWGGKYETIENAQDFLEAATEKGVMFVSDIPSPPKLSVPAGPIYWEIYSFADSREKAKLQTIDRCLSMLSVDYRMARHRISSDVLTASAWRWQQGVDWSRVNVGSPPSDFPGSGANKEFFNNVRKDNDLIYLHGAYSGGYQGESVELIEFSSRPYYAPERINGRSVYSGNEYRIALIPEHPAFVNNRIVYEGVSSERFRYAVAFLSIMCRQQ